MRPPGIGFGPEALLNNKLTTTRHTPAASPPDLQPIVVRPQRVGGDAAAGFCKHDLKRMDIGTAVLARVLEVARVVVGF